MSNTYGYANYVFILKNNEFMVLILLGYDRYWLTEKQKIQNYAYYYILKCIIKQKMHFSETD